MTDYPEKTKIHLDSTNLGSNLTTSWVEKLKALGLSDTPPVKALIECQEAIDEYSKAIVAWRVYLYCWTGKTIHPMTSNRYNSIVEELGTRTARVLASIEPAEKAQQKIEQVLVEITSEIDSDSDSDSDSVEHLRHNLADEESELNAEPIKGVSLGKNLIPVSPELADKIGWQEAIVLQQIHYWLNKGAGKLINGIRWMWKTLDDWVNEFKGFSKWEVRRALRRLRDELGLVKFSQQQKHHWNRTGWYTINYKRLKALLLSTCEPPHVEVWEATRRGVTVHTSYSTETSSETSSETTAPSSAAILNFEEEEDPWSVGSTSELQPAAAILNFEEEEEGSKPNLLASLVDQEEEDKPNLLASLVDQEEEDKPNLLASLVDQEEEDKPNLLASLVDQEEEDKPNLLASLVDQEEEDKPNLLASLVDQEELTGVASKTLGRDNFSEAASASVEKMDLVADAGIPLNPQLKRTLVNYTLQQVKAAVEHYRSVSREKRLNNPAGWLTECLKGQWWVVGTVTRQEVPHPASRVYTAADFEVKKSPTVPQSFKDMIAGLPRKHKLAT